MVSPLSTPALCTTAVNGSPFNCSPFSHLFACTVPLYLEHIRMIVRSYARADTAKGVVRKFALLTSQRVVGRSSECAYTTFHGLKWDAHFQHIFLEWPQPKSHKLKLGALGAGLDRNTCWFLAFADYFV